MAGKGKGREWKEMKWKGREVNAKVKERDKDQNETGK